MFLGGALQDKAEIRVSSIKGMLRSWYRAVDPEFYQLVSKDETREERIFGGTRGNSGQSRFLLRLRTVEKNSNKVGEKNYDSFGKLNYITFSLKKHGKIVRKYIHPTSSIELDVIAHPLIKKKDQCSYWQAMIASLWLLGNLGALGSRNRRGFGQVRLNSWESKDSFVSELIKQLPLLSEAESIKEWEELFQKGLRVLSEWFKWETYDIQTIGSIYYHKQGKDSWDKALAEGADKIKAFRQNKKGHLHLAMGLPVIQSFQSKNSRCMTKYVPEGFPRLASPVQLRVIKIKNKYHPIFLFPSESEMFSFNVVKKVEWKKRGQKNKWVTDKRQESTIKGIDIKNMVSEFIELLPEENWRQLTSGRKEEVVSKV